MKNIKRTQRIYRAMHMPRVYATLVQYLRPRHQTYLEVYTLDVLSYSESANSVHTLSYLIVSKDSLVDLADSSQVIVFRHPRGEHCIGQWRIRLVLELVAGTQVEAIKRCRTNFCRITDFTKNSPNIGSPSEVPNVNSILVMSKQWSLLVPP